MKYIMMVLNFILKITNTISHWTSSVPSWVFKIIRRFYPSAQELLDAIDGKKTSISTFLAIALAFMEKYNWTDLGGKLCSTVDFVLSIINKYANTNYVCDPTWFPAVATIITAILINAARIVSKGKIHPDIKPIGQ